MDATNRQEKEFYCELVNRFFNENSYFFHCINYELDGILTETKDGENEIYLNLGNFFDKLIATENVVEELERLKQVNEFFEFVDKLEQSVAFLHNNELDTERMKIEIEGLAHSMFNSALLAFQTPNTTNDLKDYISDNEFLEQIEEPSNQKLEQPEIEELSSTEPVEVESGLPDETESLKESQGYPDEKDIQPVAKIDTDVRLTGGLKNSMSIEGSSSILSEDKTVTSHPDSFFSAFKTEIREKINALKKLEEKENLTAKNWKQLIETIDSIMMTSVIYGLEAYEQIAGKSKKLLKKLISEEQFDTAKALLTRTIDSLTTLVESKDPENATPSFVKKATASLTGAQRLKENTVLNEQAFHEEKIETEKKSFRKTITEIKDEAPLRFSQDITQIKIPGEDDEEIHNLIAEISSETAQKRSNHYSNNAETVASRFENDEVIRVDVNTSEEDRTFSIYRQQAELYFNVIEDALHTLERQRRNQTALEDLELASNALYGLSLKLNLDPIGKFPDLILTLIKNILATKYTITENDHTLIRKGFNYFKSLGNIQEADGTPFDQIIDTIIALNEQVKNQASQEMNLLSYPSTGRIGFA